MGNRCKILRIGVSWCDLCLNSIVLTAVLRLDYRETMKAEKPVRRLLLDLDHGSKVEVSIELVQEIVWEAEEGT